MTVTHLKPEGMHSSPVFTQAIVVSAGTRLVFIGGQDGVNEKGETVGKDLAAQATQAVANMVKAIAAAGGGIEHLIKCTIYLVHGQDLRPAFGAWQKAWGDRPNPPTVSMVQVAALGNPEWLIEIDGIAALP